MQGFLSYFISLFIALLNQWLSYFGSLVFRFWIPFSSRRQRLYIAWLGPVFINNGFLYCDELRNRGFNIFPLIELCAFNVARRTRRPRPLSDRGKIIFSLFMSFWYDAIPLLVYCKAFDIATVLSAIEIYIGFQLYRPNRHVLQKRKLLVILWIVRSMTLVTEK